MLLDFAGGLPVTSKQYNMLDADSQAYARICAEELCEKLNENY